MMHRCIGGVVLAVLLIATGAVSEAVEGTADGKSAETEQGRVGGRGFGEDVEWFSFDAGIREAEATERPAMVVIHKSWSPS